MTLRSLLEALSINANITITLIDENDANIISFNAPGYAAVEDTLLDGYEVKRIKISSSSAVMIFIGQITNNSETTND